MNAPRKKWAGETPRCDFCNHSDNITKFGEFFDDKTFAGPWAILCRLHFAIHGACIGQHYKLIDGAWEKVGDLHKA